MFLCHLKALDDDVSVELWGSIIILDLTSRSVHMCTPSTMFSLKISLVKESQISCLLKFLTNFGKKVSAPIKLVPCHLTEMII